MNTSIWPGFVDAMTGLLLVLMFVLTIFMVIQFVLRETITGQETELHELSAEITSLSQALGLEQNLTAALQGDLSAAQDTAQSQSALIASLTQQRDQQALALTEAQNQITGFETQVAGLLADQQDAATRISGLEAEKTELIDQQTELVSQQDALNLALAQARSEIDEGAEAARLAAARREALAAMIADLETQRDGDAAQISDLETQRDGNLVQISELETQRDGNLVQISELEALRDENAAQIVELEDQRRQNMVQISDLEAAQLVDAAAAQALRDKLLNADAELTAMTLALEEQRRDAENTLTLLAAANAASADLDMKLAAAILAQQQAENDLTRALSEGDDLDARLVAALSLHETTAAELADARAQLDETQASNQDLTTRLAAALADKELAADDFAAVEAALQSAMANSEKTRAEVQENLASALLAQQALAAELDAANQSSADIEAQRLTLEERLAEAMLNQQALQAQVSSLADGQSETLQQRANLEARLAEAVAAIAAAQGTAQAQMTEAERQAALLASANAALSDEKALSAESQRQVAALNAQVAELRGQVSELQSLLNLAEDADAQSNVQIESLGSQLNTALARVAAEERRRRVLEEAERTRLEAERAALEAEAQDLERFKSDFFGQIRQVLEGQDGVKIVGDRFVFSSEVLFQPGQAELSPQGRAEITKVATILRDIAAEIPDGIDWVIRVDGHTDDVPLSGLGQYRDNWELSQARALSVVRYMVDFLGIPPDRLAANGFGQYQPINPADTSEARAQNRRIELKLTEK